MHNTSLLKTYALITHTQTTPRNMFPCNKDRHRFFSQRLRTEKEKKSKVLLNEKRTEKEKILYVEHIVKFMSFNGRTIESHMDFHCITSAWNLPPSASC